MKTKSKGRASIGSAYYRDLDRTLHTVGVGEHKTYIRDDRPETLSAMVKFMERVIYSEDVPYKFVTVKGDVTPRVASHGMVTSMLMLQKFANLYVDGLHFSPLLRFFFKCYRDHPLIEEWCEVWIQKTLYCNERQAQVFNEFVQYMRQRAKEIKLKSAIANWERNSNGNADRLNAYIPALFEKYGRLVFVRIDLEYKKYALSKAEVNAAADELLAMGQGPLSKREDQRGEDFLPVEYRADIGEIVQDRERLMTNLRKKKSIFKDLVGYVIRIECSMRGVYHMHAAFIFGHSMVQQHEWMGEQIGQYWNNDITEGRGHYHNCNRNNYPNYTVGIVEYHEADRRAALMETLCYLAKKDQFVHVKPSKRGKMFTTGQVPKMREKRLGRPRKKGFISCEPISDKVHEAISEIPFGQQGKGFATSTSDWASVGTEKITGRAQ